MMRTHVFCVALLFCLAGCSPSSLDDFRCEGESLCKELTQELRGIETSEQLIKEGPKIKTYFDKLAILIIQARKFQQEHEYTENFVDGKSLASQNLLSELKRIYQMEGGRDIIEKAEQEALIKLSIRK
jgi:hypothetical protein